jgi:3-methyladenine DNA glycosylase AlkD
MGGKPRRGTGRGKGTRAPDISRRLAAIGDPDRALILGRFFKTGPGQYGEGDLFHGVPVPEIRKEARRCRDLAVPEAERLLRSAMHEERLLALFILVDRYRRGGAAERERIYRLYLEKIGWINNWDLVDSSAEHIPGAHLRERDRAPLIRLAGSQSLWERRIAVMATFHYVKEGAFDETLRIAELLVDDPEDLVHKAVGWMLREVGKRDRRAEERFLARHCRTMPRTMLRYAIEHFPEALRRRYLRGDI